MLLPFFFLCILPLHAAPISGVVEGEGIRLRRHADTDSAILHAIEKGTDVTVLAEEEDFFRIEYPIHCYIYKRFVQDGQVRGTHVNIRSRPTLSAPIIGQVSAPLTLVMTGQEENDWLEIQPPKGLECFIAKKFVATTTEHKKEKRVLKKAPQRVEPAAVPSSPWAIEEKRRFEAWRNGDTEKTEQDYIEAHKNALQVLRGTLRKVQVKAPQQPGDWMLWSHGIPVAFLYSTDHALEKYLDQRIVLSVLERENNHFAYPAYRVITIEPWN